MQRTPQAELAAQSPPSCLSCYELVVLPPVQAEADAEVIFALACKACGGDVFELLGFPKVAPEPSPYFGIAPGQTFFQPPHSLRCTRCGDRGTLFDAETQGYDGVLNGGCSYESGTGTDAPMPGKFKVEVGFIYNIDLEELQEIADEDNVSVPDLFDFIRIVGKNEADAPDIEIAYECA